MEQTDKRLLNSNSWEFQYSAVSSGENLLFLGINIVGRADKGLWPIFYGSGDWNLHRLSNLPRVTTLMSDGSEARQGDDSLGMEIPEPLDMRLCPGYTNQELSSLPSHILLPRMLQGDSWYPEEVPGPREWLKSQPNSWLNPWAQIHCLSPKLRPSDGLGDQNMHLSPSPPPPHMILFTAALQWDFLVVRWPPWMTSSLLDSNWLRTQDILNQLPTWQLHGEFTSSSTDQTWTRSCGYSLAGNGISWAGGVLGA